MKNKIYVMSLLFFVGCSSSKHPSAVSTYQDLPTVKISDIKTKQSYGDVLQGEYSSFYDDDANTLDSIKKALQNDPTSNYLRVRLSYEYAKAENYEECLKLLDEVLKEKPKDFDALFLYARVLAVRGDFDQSKNYFLQILDLSEIRQDIERKVDVSFILASLYVEKEEYKRAEELLKEIIEEAPDHLLAHYYLARVYSEQNHMDQALAMYKKAVDIDPRFSLAWKAIGLVDEYFKKWDQAIVAYNHVIELEPQNVDVRTRLIEIYQQQNKPEKIVAQIKEIKNLYPNVPDVFIRLGLFYYEQKQFKEAEDEFSQAIQKFKNDSDFYYYLGLVHYQMKRRDQAEKDFSNVQLNSDVYITSRLALSSLLEEMKKPDQAEKNLVNALNKKPTSADLRIGLSNVMIRNKKYTEAQHLIEEGIQASPKEEKYYLSLAEIYDRKKQYDDLEKTIRSLLAIYPDSASGLNFLGFSLVDRNIRIPEAEKMLNRALALKPFDGYIVDSVGWLYFRKKQFKDAEKMFREALKDIPDEPIILEHFADTLVELTKKQDALVVYKKILTLSEDEDQKKVFKRKSVNYLSSIFLLFVASCAHRLSPITNIDQFAKQVLAANPSVESLKSKATLVISTSQKSYNLKAGILLDHDRSMFIETYGFGVPQAYISVFNQKLKIVLVSQKEIYTGSSKSSLEKIIEIPLVPESLFDPLLQDIRPLIIKHVDQLKKEYVVVDSLKNQFHIDASNHILKIETSDGKLIEYGKPLSATTNYPRSVKMKWKENSIEIFFDDVILNQQIDKSLFQIDVPTQGFHVYSMEPRS